MALASVRKCRGGCLNRFSAPKKMGSAWDYQSRRGLSTATAGRWISRPKWVAERSFACCCQSQGRSHRMAKILLIEDNPSDANSLREALLPEGYAVKPAA